MDLTPPYHRSDSKSHTKSASRLARPLHFESEDSLRLSLDIVPSSPMNAANTPSPSPLPLHELLLISPPIRRSRTRLADRLEMAEELIEPIGSRRKCKNRGGSIASPKNLRRSRRRFEVETRDEREVGVVEEVGKVKKKKKHGGQSKKDRLSLVVPSAPLPPKIDDGDGCNLDEIGHLISDLIMWEDVSKSIFWFGFGSLCFLSSCFASGINFSIFSMMSQLCLLFLGLSFFSNTICQRGHVENKRRIKLSEEDLLRAARVILPVLNFVISKTRELFSGEPTMTLKVALFLVIGSEYGHLMTLWRLCALGFFISFTGPKLYSCYSTRINNRVEGWKKWAYEAWGGCSHKKIVAASAATAFWNLTAFRTRIFAAFIVLVVLRYYKQAAPTSEEEENDEQQALVVVRRAA